MGDTETLGDSVGLSHLLSEFTDSSLEWEFRRARHRADVRITVVLCVGVMLPFVLYSLLDLTSLAIGQEAMGHEISWRSFWVRNTGILAASLSLWTVMRATLPLTHYWTIFVVLGAAMALSVVAQWGRPPEFVGGANMILLVPYLAPLPLRYILGATVPYSIALLHLYATHKVPAIPFDRTVLFVSIIAFNAIGYAFARQLARLHRRRYIEGVELQRARDAAEEALQEVKMLSGLLPICARCKKIRDENETWQVLESYITTRSDAEFTHGLCPECAEYYMGDDSSA